MKQRVYFYDSDNIRILESISRYKYALNFVKDKLTVDIGCGGRKGPYILADFASSVIGLDISKEAVYYSAKKWPRSNLLYMAADAKALPFKNESFDCILSFEVIEHIEDYNKYLSEVSRILKNSGVFIISTPNRCVTSPRGVFSNPDHIREFDFSQISNALLPFFGNLNIYGQFPSERVKQIEYYRKENYRILSRIPGFFKKILPKKIKEAFIRSFIYFSLKFGKHLDENKINEEDFLFSNKNTELAKYFLVVCKK